MNEVKVKKKQKMLLLNVLKIEYLTNDFMSLYL